MVTQDCYQILLYGWICLSEICFAALPNHVYLLDHPVYLSSSKRKHVARNILGCELLKFFFQYVIQRWSEMSTIPIKICHGISKTSQITWLTTNITQSMHVLHGNICRVSFNTTVVILLWHENIAIVPPVVWPWILHQPVWTAIYSSISNEQHCMVQLL